MLEADYEDSGSTVTHDGAGIVQINGNVTTNGGNFQLGSGATATLGGVSTQVGGDLYLMGSSAQTFSTGGGSVLVKGETIIGNSNGLTINSGGGAVTFDGVVNSGNSYSLVTATLDWAGALAAAKSAGTGANAGDTYLATITSRLENAIASRAANYQTAWLGGRREVGLGTDTSWRWKAGPEGLQDSGKGLIFFTQNTTGSGGSTPTGAYSNWASGEPNNAGASNTSAEGESATQFTGTMGKWNDFHLLQNSLDTKKTKQKICLESGLYTKQQACAFLVQA